MEVLLASICGRQEPSEIAPNRWGYENSSDKSGLLNVNKTGSSPKVVVGTGFATESVAAGLASGKVGVEGEDWMG